ncbi:MAG: hypothetical protein QM687_15460 [Ferruginibacter sp.]
MSLDNIQLTSSLVEKLYSKSLYDLDKPDSAAPVQNSTAINSLGYNEKNILIIVDESEAVHLEDNDLKLLTGILNACKLSLADVALVNYHRNPSAAFASLNSSFNPAVVFLFGVEPVTLGFPLQFPSFQLQKYNGQQYLHSPSLKALALEKDLKKQLWDILQKLF